MNKIEAVVLGAVIAVLCPGSLLVAFWWTAAALAIHHVLPIADRGIAAAAFSGLGIGIVLDAFCLKNWIARFYNADLKWMVPAYLFWSAIAVAFFMGLPLGNIILGTLAGLYVGRKQHHARADGHRFAKAAGNASIFTALVTGAEALPIGLLALHERIVADTFQALTGLDRSAAAGPIGIGLVGACCAVLMLVQFWCTRAAAALGFRLGQEPP